MRWTRASGRFAAVEAGVGLLRAMHQFLNASPPGLWRGSRQKRNAKTLLAPALTLLLGGVSDEVYAQASAEFSETELTYLTSAIASINTWNRFGAAYRWTPAERPKKAGAAA